MFPIVLDATCVSIALVGNGKAALRRLQQLDEATATQVTVYAENAPHDLQQRAGKRLKDALPSDEELQKHHVVMVADLDEAVAAGIAIRARKLGKLVNVEDRKLWCDFHFPSLLRRGDLLLTVSTGGKSPALARSIKKILAKIFGQEWKDHVIDIGYQREAWQQQGLSFDDVMQRSDAYIEEKGWLYRIAKDM